MTSPAASPSPIPFALRALFFVVGLIVAFAYAICAWQVFGFADHVWQLPLALCFGAAFVADLLSLAGLFATYLLRRAPRKTQAYAWVVFLGMAGLSIAAAESYASWRFAKGVKPAVDADARVASAAIVVALALAVHLLIICRNHLSHSDEAPTAPPSSAPSRPRSERKLDPESKTEEPQVKQQRGKPQPRRLAEAKQARQLPAAPATEREQLIRKVADKEISAAEAAAKLNRGVRAIEMAAKKIRDEMAATPSADPVQSASEQQERPVVLPDATPINGHATNGNGGATA